MKLSLCDGIVNEFEQTPAADVGGVLAEPRAVVIHYTAGRNSIEALTATDERYVSAHFLIDRMGHARQLVSCEQVAWHAGRSFWQGQSGLNQWSIGIELENWGPLLERGGKFFAWPQDYQSVEVPQETVRAGQHKDEACGHEYWQTYTARQQVAVTKLLGLLVREYPIAWILGHDDVSPGRKIDPGPAFPMEYMQIVFETQLNGRQAEGRRTA